MKNNIFFIVIFSSFFVLSQDYDFQSWNNIEFTHDITNNSELAMDNGFRFSDNSSVMSKYFFDFSVKKKYSKVFNYSIGYRYILFREFDPLELEKKNRFYLDGYFKNSITNKFKYSIRTRFQTQVDRDFSFSQDVTNKLRQKIKLIYDVDKSNVDLVFSVESFYLLGDFFEKIRYQVGCVKPISEKTKFNISYMLQQELDHSELFFIMRAKLSHEF